MPILEVKGLTKLFGKLAALHRIDLKVTEGEIVGLVGPNGSGKSTLFSIISGHYRPTSGVVLWDGKRISGLRPDQIARTGVLRAFQANVSFGDTTVLENLLRASVLLGNANLFEVFFNTRRCRADEMKMKERADEMLEFWQLTRWRDSLATSLPHGLQRVLGLAMAMASRPSLLLLDEPLTGMHPEEVTTICEHIRRINQLGIAVILVEHNIRSIRSICPRLVVLSFGEKIAEGPCEEVLRDKEVVRAYLGEGVA